MHRRSTLSILLCLLAGLVAAGPARAGPDYAGAVRNLAAGHMMPRYEKLQTAAEAFETAAAAACKKPADLAGFITLRQRFHRFADAWMGVQHINFGPAKLFLRGVPFVNKSKMLDVAPGGRAIKNPPIA